MHPLYLKTPIFSGFFFAFCVSFIYEAQNN